MGYRNNTRYRRKRNEGLEMAKKHIQEAKNLSVELGGTDKDVKLYLFSLSKKELNSILNEYGENYGTNAREYAIKTIPKWKSNKVLMSGLVAERMYSILPKFMPMNEKLKLVDSLWTHLSPSSYKEFIFNIDSISSDNIVNTIKNYFNEFMIEYKIPHEMEQRFKWLANGDIEIKQDLLNYFLKKDKAFNLESLNIQLPILIHNINNNIDNNIIINSKHTITIGKHNAEIILINQKIIEEEEKERERQLSRQSEEKIQNFIILFLIALSIVYMYTK